MIKQFREKTGLTQSEAAKKLGINVGFFNRVESDVVDLPPRHYKKVSKLFKIPVKKLIEFRVKKFAKQLEQEAK